MERWPFVTVIIVAYNEEEYIGDCLKSVLHQTYPGNSYEILIVNGMSTDNTINAAQGVIDEYKSTAGKVPEIKFLRNPGRILASGWNLGIRSAQGEYVVRIDAHATVASDFLEKSVETILDVRDVVCVGGPLNTASRTKQGELVRAVLTSPFGVGGARFRYQKTPGYVDTVAYGLYRKDIFEQVGYLDESLERTQDNDLHRRIRAAGGRFFLNPAIRATYYCRDSVRGMLNQAFRNGRWTMINFRRRPGRMALRHFAPLFFVLGLVLLALLSFFYPSLSVLLLGILSLHHLCGLAFGLNQVGEFRQIVILPWLFLALHLSYGLGSISGLFQRIA